MAPLEVRMLLAAAFSEFVDPNPAAGNQFGATVTPLSTGNVVITAPGDDAGGVDAGAVYLFSGATGELLSTLTGSTAGDQIGDGGAIALTNGNYVIISGGWDNGLFEDAGAITFANGNTGVSGVISAANSLVGATAFEYVGDGGVTTLTNGNYVVSTTGWDDGLVQDVGAATWGSGTTGITGTISAANSLIGSTEFDAVGSYGIVALTNGNYVVSSGDWNNGPLVDVGAATFGDGTTGVVGVVSETNSLVGASEFDTIGDNGTTALSNGNYIVSSGSWHNGTAERAGAVTFGSGTSGIVGVVSATNSLVGEHAQDRIGEGGFYELPNNRVVILSSRWDNGLVTDAGAVTWVDSTAPITGFVSAANSLIGGAAGNSVGEGGLTVLTNGHYVVRSIRWDDPDTGVANVGAVTWVNGTTGLTGLVTAANSLIGSSTEDVIGFYGVTPLTNGNYVVNSPFWGANDLGAVTWGNGATGTTGVVSASNSLVGSTANDQIGIGSITALTNGNYVVSNYLWDNSTIVNAGAATWGNGTTGISGAVSTSNSLYGGTNDDRVSVNGVTALVNGNYVVVSPSVDNGPFINQGAVTWGDGTSGVTGLADGFNSLTGESFSTQGDLAGSGGITPLSNGNYVVSSPLANLNDVASGAVTWLDGTKSFQGSLYSSSANSLLGVKNDDQVGTVVGLANGNYVVLSPTWDQSPQAQTGALVDAGAVTFGDGTTGVKGEIYKTPIFGDLSHHSIYGGVENSGLQYQLVLDDVNGNFFGVFATEGGGRVRVGSQTSGFNNLMPTSVSLSNALTSLPENTDTTQRIKVADVTGVDDAIGFNAFEILGTDASQFEVVFKTRTTAELFLKAGVSLNYETQPQYNLTVSYRDTDLNPDSRVTVAYQLTLTNLNEEPLLGGFVANQVVDDDATIMPFTTATVTDPDTQDMFAKVRILNGVVRGDFTAASTTGWTRTVTGNNIVYTRYFSPVPAIGDAVQTAMRALVFQPRTDAIKPGLTEKTAFDVFVTDGISNASNAETSVVTNSVNGAPTLGGVVTGQPVNDNATIQPFSAVTLTDSDTQDLYVKVTISNGVNRGDFTTASAAGWTKTVTGANLVYTRYFSPMANVGATVQAMIRGLVFQPRANAIEPGTTETTAFTVFINDGLTNITNGQTTVITTSVNEAPVLDGTLANQPVNDNATLAPFATVTLTDPDTQDMFVKVTISNGVNRGDFTPASAIGWTRTVTGFDIVYTRYFSETAAIGATVQVAVRALDFQPRSNVPIGTNETTAFTLFLTDGVANVTNTQTSVVTTGVAPRAAASIAPAVILDRDTTTVVVPTVTKPRTEAISRLLRKPRSR